MKYLMSADWWRAASIRAAKTMFQTGAALVVTKKTDKNQCQKKNNMYIKF